MNTIILSVFYVFAGGVATPELNYCTNTIAPWHWFLSIYFKTEFFLKAFQRKNIGFVIVQTFLPNSSYCIIRTQLHVRWILNRIQILMQGNEQDIVLNIAKLFLLSLKWHKEEFYDLPEMDVIDDENIRLLVMKVLHDSANNLCI